MKILVCGATGFVGRHITASLRQAGHTVIRAIRKPSASGDIAVDFTNDNNKAVWLTRLEGVDAVVNAVGVLRDTPAQPMRLLLEQTPLALFAACEEVGVKRIVQISALGIETGMDTLYFETRRAPEAFLNTLSAQIRYLIMRPSVIYGEDGASAKMFRLQAALPVHFLPAGGSQTLQPVHIDDICEGIQRWLDNPDAKSQTIAAVGQDVTDMKGMLDSYRQQQHKTKALHVSIPGVLVSLSAKIGDFIAASPLSTDTLKMLNGSRGADPAVFAGLLGRPPKSYTQFIAE
jgi:uncharacterized protein YbjT (DUF2867 family)